MARYFVKVVWRVVLSASLGGVSLRSFAQGPTPETGNTIFPGGGLVSYAAGFTFRKAPASIAGGIPPTISPTLEFMQPLMFSWGIRRDLELTAMTSITTNRLDLPDSPSEIRMSGSGLGDSLVLVKYRFIRRDSERGTTPSP